LAGCGKSSDAAVTGILNHTHRMTFPVGTVVTIQISDVTKSGSPGKVIAEQVINDQEVVVPTPFMVIYHQGKINAEHSYSISVKIQDASGKLQYTSERSIPVITKGNPTQDIDILLVLYGE
jgi:putative lipoprotein